VETLGEALSYGWRVTARCAAGKQDGMHRHKECVYRAELDMETLVWTRGRGFPCRGWKAACVVRTADRATCSSSSQCQAMCRRRKRASDSLITMQVVLGWLSEARGLDLSADAVVCALRSTILRVLFLPATSGWTSTGRSAATKDPAHA
jgi:hypothetical protein